MELFVDIKVDGKYIIVFDFDEYSKVKIESQRTMRLIPDIVRDVLAWGIRRYKYTKPENAVC